MTDDPRTRHAQPDSEGEDLAHPGLTADMRDRPDHGEQSYVGSGLLEGRRAVITGGDSGIGRAVAIAFAREGADVLISHLPQEQPDADETLDWVRRAGRKGVSVPGDLQQERACDDLVVAAVRELGGIDVLVNNAAYQMAQPGGIEDITTEQWERTLRTNLTAMFWLTRAALPHLGAGSVVLNTTSIQATTPSPELLDYAITKAGIVTFTKALGMQLAERGIRVNAVAPGPIWTPLIPATMTDEKIAEHGESTPLGRAGQPAEVAPVYVFFASDHASYITSEVLGVAGGNPTR